MPFLRVLRDKRGYETTYLMHWFREGSRQRSRILYVFRTPPGVRVGRDALDPQIIREIQEKYPDIEFDWRALRENQQVIETSPDLRRPRASGRSGRAEPAEGRGKRRKEEDAEKPAADRIKAEPVHVPPSPVREPRPKLAIPSAIEGTTREDRFVFLLNWYLHLRERVPHRTHDPIRREALLGLVERLNPEAWVGEEAVVAGLQHAAEALQRLSHIFAKRRKRARRAKTGATEHMAAAEVGASAEAAEASASLEPSEPFEPAEPFELSGPSEPPDPPEPLEPFESSEPPDRSEPRE